MALAARSPAGVDRRQLADFAEVQVCVNHVASMFAVFFTRGPVKDFASAKGAAARRYARFFHALLKRGVYFPPSQFEAVMLSSKHSAADLDATLDAAAKAFKEL